MNTSVNTAPAQIIVTCLEDHPKAIMLLRTARQRAQEKQAKWCAVFVETPHSQKSEDAPRDRMLWLLTMAEQMGGKPIHIEAETVEKGLQSLLEKERSRLALVIVGSSDAYKRPRWFNTPHWMKIVRLASRYAQVEILPLSGQRYQRKIRDRLRWRSLHPHNLVYAVAAVSVAYIGALFLQWIFPPALFRINDQNVALLFMIACAFVAGRYGLLPGLVASVTSFLTVNYYFTLPYHVLKLNTITDALNMLLFLSAALLISLFTSQARDYAQKATRRERSTQALFTLYRVASETFTREQALEKLQRRLERMLEVKVAFFLPTVLHPDQIEPAYPHDLKLEDEDRKALNTCWNETKTTGLNSPYNPGTGWRFEPMMSPTGEVGVLGIKPFGKTMLDSWFGLLLTAIADQTASVLQHIGLERSMEEARLREEREKLRAMLLSSVSHDLKTPLASIIGALSVHRSLGERLTSQKRGELIETALDEAQRLDNFITNILDMTRLESGNIQFKKEWHEVKTLLDGIKRRMRDRCKQHVLIAQPGADGLEVNMDIVMTGQVLQNIIDNACKYTPSQTQIEISCSAREGAGFICEIRDYGPGIPAEKLDRIFDKYLRLQKKDSQVAGTGLGLAIAKAVMEAQGGWITAANHPQGGAVFTLCLPEWRINKRSSQTVIEQDNDAAAKRTYTGH